MARPWKRRVAGIGLLLTLLILFLPIGEVCGGKGFCRSAPDNEGCTRQFVSSKPVVTLLFEWLTGKESSFGYREYYEEECREEWKRPS